MSKLTESEIETLAIERFQALGFDYVYAPDIAPDSLNPERDSFAEVLLTQRLRNAVARINPTLPPASLDEAIKTIQRISSPELLANNEAFHRLLTEGVNVSYQKDGNTRGDLVWLVDFDDPDNNEFVVANQFTIIENNQNKRPDIILFVNGAEKSSKPAENLAVVEDFCSRLSVLPYTEKAAQHYGQIRTALEKKGEPIGVNDLHIAAHARSEGLMLVTNNEKEFAKVPSLQIENWVVSRP